MLGLLIVLTAGCLNPQKAIYLCIQRSALHITRSFAWLVYQE